MTYDKLDNEELLRIALDAINHDHHADAVSLLKALLARDASHVYANYLLAAEHAQLGMIDRAEEGFRKTVALAPDFPMARFQLGQIQLTRGNGSQARSVLEPLTRLPAGEALSAYARGLIAAADEDLGEAIHHLRTGLACEQDVPALAADMQRVLGNLTAMAGNDPAVASTPASLAPMYLSNYGRSGS